MSKKSKNFFKNINLKSNKSLILAATLLIILITIFTPKLIDFTGKFAGGDGLSSETAYEIETCAELQAMKDDLTAHYKLMNDINFNTDTGCEIYTTGAGFEPIGNSINKFTGTFDGQGYIITNLFINRSDTNRIGLFGQTDAGIIDGKLVNSKIKNTGLVNVDITGYNQVGSLVGFAGSLITNSYATGTITGIFKDIGGLIGFSYYSSISNSYSTVNVNGVKNTGGLVGQNSGSTITNSYATGTITGTYDPVGGLVGLHNSGTITNSYFTDANNDNSIGNLETIGPSAFYVSNHPVYQTWDFTNFWQEVLNHYPTLLITEQLLTTEQPTCTDGIQNQDETGIDCGGPCSPCALIGEGTAEITSVIVRSPLGNEITWAEQGQQLNVRIEMRNNGAIDNIRIELIDADVECVWGQTCFYYVKNDFIGDSSLGHTVSFFMPDKNLNLKAIVYHEEPSGFFKDDEEIIPTITLGAPTPTCGDDTAEGSEECDGIDLKGEDCITQGFDSGTLSCLLNCTGFNTSQCTIQITACTLHSDCTEPNEICEEGICESCTPEKRYDIDTPYNNKPDHYCDDSSELKSILTAGDSCTKPYQCIDYICYNNKCLEFTSLNQIFCQIKDLLGQTDADDNAFNYFCLEE